jgi:SAM-dependent methyltransferase
MTYYDKFAQEYSENTLSLDMSELYVPFLKLLPPKGKILDLGCGPGRDLKYFKDLGHEVLGIDPSAEMVKLVSDYTGAQVIQAKAQKLSYQSEFNGIWACASLLHIPSTELPAVFDNIFLALKSHGVLFCCFKYGDFEGIKEDGRYFTYVHEDSLRAILSKTPGLSINQIWKSIDLRDEKGLSWINCLLVKNS